MYCSTCGANNQDGASYCTTCGALLPKNAPIEEKEAEVNAIETENQTVEAAPEAPEVTTPEAPVAEAEQAPVTEQNAQPAQNSTPAQNTTFAQNNQPYNPPYQQNNGANQFNNQYNYQNQQNFGAPQQIPGKGLGIASMILGIISLLALCPVIEIALPCAIVGLVLGCVARSSAKKQV